MASNFYERLGACWSCVPCIEIRSEHLIPRRAHSLKSAGALHVGIENLFVPSTHLCAPRVEVVGLVRISGIHAALGKIEHGSRIVGITFKLVAQHRAVAFVLVFNKIASAKSARLKVVLAAQSLDRPAWFGANRVLMEDAAIFPGAFEFEQLCSPIGEAGADAHHVRVGIKCIKVGFANKKIVGVHHQPVVGGAATKSQRFSAIVGEVHPFAFVKFAGDSCFGKVGTDEILGSI